MKIEENITLAELSAQSFQLDDDEDERPRYTHYLSNKVLGKLHRNINEHAFLEQLQSSIKSIDTDGPDLLDELWAYARHQTLGFIWQHHISTAKDIKAM